MNFRHLIAMTTLMNLLQSLSPALASEGKMHPDYSALKPFRNYYRLEKPRPAAHHFEAWIQWQDYGIMRCWFELNSATDLEKIGHEPQECDSAFEEPPTEFPSMPKEARALSNAIERRFETLFGKLGFYGARYRGYGQTVGVTELVPMDLETDPTQRYATQSWRAFLISDQNRLVEIEPTRPGYAYGKMGPLCHESFADWPSECEAAPTWIPFQPTSVPPGRFFADALENSADRPDVKRDLRAFTRALKRALEGRSKGIETILRKQGAETIPAGLEQTLRFNFDVSGRATSWEDQYWENIELEIPLQANFQAGWRKEIELAPVEMKVEVSVDFQARRLTLSVRTRDGTVTPLQFRMNGGLIEADGRVAAGPIALEFLGEPVTEGAPKLTLPGFGKFESISISTSEVLYPEY